jgi:hypothetical protein
VHAVLIIAFTLAAPPALKRWMEMRPSEREGELADLRQKALPERLAEASQRFLGTPYLVSPLGEGSGKDPDPMIRFDAVDCLTFVEETIALSLAERMSEVEPVLTNLRYAHEPTYQDRNHLMESQWIPNNLHKGFVRETTQTYGGEATVQLVKQLTERTWKSRASVELGLSEENRPIGAFSLSVIPLRAAMAIAPRIPSGTVLVVVRENSPLKATQVSHLGFVVRKGSRTYLRHAARHLGRVVDEDLRAFLERSSKYAKWKVVGVSLFEVTTPAHNAH